MALSDDLRKRVVEAVVVSGRAVAQRGGQAVRGEHRERGALGAALRGDGRDFAGALGRRSPLRPRRGPSRLSSGPDPPHAGHHDAGNQERLIKPTAASVSRSRCCGASSTVMAHVQKKSAHAAEQQRAGRAEATPGMVRRTARSRSRELIFIDETGASTNLARKGGRCRRGRRLRASVPHGHYKTVTLVAGLRLRGLVAQKVFDRPINAALFEEWVETCLVPTLSKGDVVVMDNLPAHKGPRVEKLIKPSAPSCDICRPTART